jgi:Tfp pilus assembly PilM family ATPase
MVNAILPSRDRQGSQKSSASRWNQTGLIHNAGRITGVDLGSRSVKLVASRWNKSNYRVTHAHCMEWSHSYANLDRAIPALVEWLNEYGDPDSRELAISLPNEIIDQEIIELPPEIAVSPSRANLDKFAREVLADLIGESAKNAIYDGWLNSNGRSSTLNLVWTDREYVTRLAQQLANARWFCRSMEIASVVQVRTADFNTDTSSGKLLLDLCGSSVSFLWILNGVPQYRRWKIPLGAQTPSEIVAQKMNISSTQASVLLASSGIHADPALQLRSLVKQLERCLEEYLNNLEYEINRTRQYLNRQYPEFPLREVMLTGGVGSLVGLDRRLSERLALNTQAMTVPAYCDWDAAIDFSPQFSVAATLAHPVVPS